MTNKKYRPNVAIIIVKNNKILLVKKSDWESNSWYCPCGGIKEGETKGDAAKREFQEELGNNKFKLLYVSKVIHKFDWNNELLKRTGFNGQEQGFVVMEFLGEASDIKLNYELSDYRFSSYEELDSLIVHKEFLNKMKLVLKRYYKDIKNEK